MLEDIGAEVLFAATQEAFDELAAKPNVRRGVDKSLIINDMFGLEGATDYEKWLEERPHEVMHRVGKRHGVSEMRVSQIVGEFRKAVRKKYEEQFVS